MTETISPALQTGMTLVPGPGANTSRKGDPPEKCRFVFRQALASMFIDRTGSPRFRRKKADRFPGRPPQHILRKE